MNRVPIVSLQPKKADMLKKSPCKPQFYLSIESNEFSESLNTTIYNIEVGLQSDHDILLYRVKARYSELMALDKKLEVNKTPFPPKTILPLRSKEKIAERQNQLQKYLDSLTSNPTITQNQDFVNFFHLPTSRTGQNMSHI